jgi:hypothetical protein
MSTSPLHVSEDDFFTGLFAALAARRFETVGQTDESFFQAVERAFDRLQQQALERRLDVRFRVRLHPIHRDSEVVREGLSRAARARLVSLDNPAFRNVRLCISPSEASRYLERLPGGPELYNQLADSFIAS